EREREREREAFFVGKILFSMFSSSRASWEAFVFELKTFVTPALILNSFLFM
ncbi:unnamed protein product, partial [Musa acuminata subsp. burmannicoides]